MTPDELFAAGKVIFSENASVAALASFLGRDRTTVWRYLNGKTPISAVVATAVQLRIDVANGANDLRRQADVITGA